MPCLLVVIAQVLYTRIYQQHLREIVYFDGFEYVYVILILYIHFLV